MSSACSRRNLGGRIVSGIASCFFPRRISLEEERAKFCSKQVPNMWNTKTPHNAAEYEEEDYIVFCFGEDGEIHIINSSQTYNQPISSHGAATCMGNGINHSPNPRKMDSCDANLSCPTTTSFAFPILGMEWIGSPVQMPNTEKCSRY